VSVISVKSEDVEYIVVDGVSDDGTLNIIKKHLDTIDQFICESDTGIYQAMNKGVAKANGEYILFINGGDELIPGGVKEVLTLLRASHEQIVCATTMVVDDATHQSFSFTPIPKRLIYGDSLPHPSSFIRRELISRFPFREDLRIASDYNFFLRVFLSGIPFKIVPYQSAVHYLGGISSNNKKRKKEVDLILRSQLGQWRMFYYKILNVFIWSRRKIANWLGGKS
jgi:glycosyltransferase involved in cell wall biosynthesis